MKCLARNKIPLYYCLYNGEHCLTDDEGFETGEKGVSYADPVKIFANVSPARGDISIEQFGTSLQYDKVVVIDDLACPIDEHSVLFIDHELSFDADGFPRYDYVVKKVAKSLNSISIAVARVEVS